jgi:hypothetical protein
MQPFDQILILALRDANPAFQVREMAYDDSDDSGLLRVTLDDGRVYSLHFAPTV